MDVDVEDRRSLGSWVSKRKVMKVKKVAAALEPSRALHGVRESCIKVLPEYLC